MTHQGLSMDTVGACCRALAGATYGLLPRCCAPRQDSPGLLSEELFSKSERVGS